MSRPGRRAPPFSASRLGPQSSLVAALFAAAALGGSLGGSLGAAEPDAPSAPPATTLDVRFESLPSRLVTAPGADVLVLTRLEAFFLIKRARAPEAGGFSCTQRVANDRPTTVACDLPGPCTLSVRVRAVRADERTVRLTIDAPADSLFRLRAPLDLRLDPDHVAYLAGAPGPRRDERLTLRLAIDSAPATMRDGSTESTSSSTPPSP